MTPVQETLLQSIADGVDPNLAAEALGISREVLRNWKEFAEGRLAYRGGSQAPEATKRNATEFYQALPQARAEGYRKLVSRLQHNANTPNAKTGWYDTQAIDKLLSKSAFRDDWHEHEKQTPEREPLPAVFHIVKQLDDHTLLQLAARVELSDNANANDAYADQ